MPGKPLGAVGKDVLPARVGWLGKIPTAGDFVVRNVDPIVHARMDEWLGRAIAASRDQLGERWLDAFLHAPVWRFILHGMPSAEMATVGIMIPSVDRVGRYFPFCVLIELDRRPATNGDLMGADALLSAFEPHLLSVLHDDFDLDTFEYEVRKLGDALRKGRSEQRDQAVAEDASAKPISADFPATWWWTEGARGRAPSFERFGELPAPATFTALLRDDDPDEDLASIWHAAGEGPTTTNAPITMVERLGDVTVAVITGPSGGQRDCAAHAEIDTLGSGIAVAGALASGERGGRDARFLCRAAARGGADTLDRTIAYLRARSPDADASIVALHGDTISYRGLHAIAHRVGNALELDTGMATGAVHSIALAAGERVVVGGSPLRPIVSTLGGEAVAGDPERAARAIWEEALIAGLPPIGFVLVAERTP